LNRAEDGTELAGDPDSEDDPVDYRVLFAMVRDIPPAPDGQGS